MWWNMRVLEERCIWLDSAVSGLDFLYLLIVLSK